jgi:hypothetical protein
MRLITGLDKAAQHFLNAQARFNDVVASSSGNLGADSSGASSSGNVAADDARTQAVSSSGNLGAGAPNSVASSSGNAGTGTDNVGASLGNSVATAEADVILNKYEQLLRIVDINTIAMDVPDPRSASSSASASPAPPNNDTVVPGSFQARLSYVTHFLHPLWGLTSAPYKLVSSERRVGRFLVSSTEFKNAANFSDCNLAARLVIAGKASSLDQGISLVLAANKTARRALVRSVKGVRRATWVDVFPVRNGEVKKSSLVTDGYSLGLVLSAPAPYHGGIHTVKGAARSYRVAAQGLSVAIAKTSAYEAYLDEQRRNGSAWRCTDTYQVLKRESKMSDGQFLEAVLGREIPVSKFADYDAPFNYGQLKTDFVLEPPPVHGFVTAEVIADLFRMAESSGLARPPVVYVDPGLATPWSMVLVLPGVSTRYRMRITRGRFLKALGRLGAGRPTTSPASRYRKDRLQITAFTELLCQIIYTVAKRAERARITHIRHPIIVLESNFGGVGGRSYASLPLSAFSLFVAEYALVANVVGYRTSSLCPTCASPTKIHPGRNFRTKLCTSEACCPPHCLGRLMNRDDVAALNLELILEGLVKNGVRPERFRSPSYSKQLEKRKAEHAMFVPREEDGVSSLEEPADDET